MNRVTTLFESIGKAGSCTLVPPVPEALERAALERAWELRRDGHAVLVDGEERGDRWANLRVTHYLSCTACQGVNRGKV